METLEFPAHALQTGRALRDDIAGLVRGASIEINVQGLSELAAGQSLLPAGTRIYVSHLPRQTWEETIALCRAVCTAGFDPVPHIPVRLLTDEAAADSLLATLVKRAHVRELLLIAGDYRTANGPYVATLDLLRTGLLSRHGIARVSFAGHPEGHPGLSLEKLWEALMEKTQYAAEAGLSVSVVTQFFFESSPFLGWVHGAHDRRISGRLIAGLAGPASIRTLVRFALHCGVGPSIRALASHASGLGKIIGEHAPETLVRELALARTNGAAFDGIHLFGFGGFRRTCEWLQRAAAGDFGADSAIAAR